MQLSCQQLLYSNTISVAWLCMLDGEFSLQHEFHGNMKATNSQHIEVDATGKIRYKRYFSKGRDPSGAVNSGPGMDKNAVPM